MKATTFNLCSAILSISASTSFFACASAGEDSWLHYMRGGMFISATPSVSSGGESMTYASPCTGHGDIYLLQNGASAPLRLTRSDDFESSPIFTVDDKRIIYVREQNQCRHIWIMNADGSEQSQLTTGSVLDDPSAVSQDGRYLIVTRAKVSAGSAKRVHAYLVQLDKPNEPLVAAGDFAIFSPDSKFVILSKEGTLYRRELGKTTTQERQLGGTGMPCDISEDGKWVLTTTTTANYDFEVSAFSTENKSMVRLATGDSPIFLAHNPEKVLFFAEQGVYLTSVYGGTPARIAHSSYNTFPRSILGGRGAIVAFFPKLSSPNFEVIFIDSNTPGLNTIASIGCTDVWFKAPLNVDMQK